MARKLVTSAVARQVISTVQKGLCVGLGGTEEGDVEEGKMCVEQAVCFAMGEPVLDNDKPSCVNHQLSDFKIVINDRGHFKNNKDRGKLLTKLSILQLGTKTKRNFNYNKFEKLVKERLILKLYPSLSSPPNVLQADKYISDLEKARNLLEDDLLDGTMEDILDRKTTLLIIQAAEEVLIKMKVPGVKYLKLIK